MNVFSRLAEATRIGNRDGDLPDFVVPLLQKVAANEAAYADRSDLVEELTAAVEQYETFSEMCCEKMGFSLEDIHRILDELQVRY